MLFVALLIASLSLSGLASASAAEPNATQTQTSNTNTLNKQVNTQSESGNFSIDSTKTQKPVDKSVKQVKTTENVKHETTQNVNTPTDVQKTASVVENVASSTIQQENSFNANEVKTSVEKTSIESSTTVDSLQQKAISSEATTIPVTDKNTNSTTTSTVNNTENTTQHAAAGTVISTATTVTNAQVIQAANYVKNYVEDNHKLPTSVDINGRTVNMYTFLYMLSIAVQNLNTNNNNPISVISFNAPQKTVDSIIAGTMGLSEYIHIADEVKVYMDKTGYVPGYASPTSLGTYISWQSMIYMYSSILDSYNSTLPKTIAVTPWKVLSDSNAGSFTNDQIIEAAKWVKNYYATSNNLPSAVIINGKSVDMYSFLYLLSTAVQNLNTNNNNPISVISFNAPQDLKEQIYSGAMAKSEYIKIADQIKVYMDKTGYMPGYASSTCLGPYFGWQSLILMYSNILNSYSVNKVLPSSTTVNPTYKFTNAQVISAAVKVKNYYDANKQLPSVASVNGMNINMYSFLYVLTKAAQNIQNNINTPITVLSYKGPQAQNENIKAGNMSLSEYIQIAGKVASYMDQTRVVPGYASNTSLGTYLGWQSMIYMYSSALSSYNTNKVLPSTVAVKPISGSSVPAELQQYLAATANCQVNDSQIKSLAASITAGKTSTYDKAVAIFNWVRDNLSYSFYYDTKYGAVGALNARTGNCVDTAHLVVALERAAGIPARYEHVYAQFSSGSWYGHVIAQVWVDGKWYNVDGSSNYNSFGVINNWNTATATIYGTYASLPF